MTLVPSLEAAWRDVDSSFERFCLTAGIGAIEQMLCEDARRLAGPRHSRGERVGQRWGATKGKIGFHGGKVVVRRPRVRSEGHEVALPTWRAAQAEDWLGRWAALLHNSGWGHISINKAPASEDPHGVGHPKACHPVQYGAFDDSLDLLAFKGPRPKLPSERRLEAVHRILRQLCRVQQLDIRHP